MDPVKPDEPMLTPNPVEDESPVDGVDPMLILPILEAKLERDGSTPGGGKS